MNIMIERYKVDRDGSRRIKLIKLKEEAGSRRLRAGRGEETEESWTEGGNKWKRERGLN
jgi:hypothetical protein